MQRLIRQQYHFIQEIHAVRIGAFASWFGNLSHPGRISEFIAGRYAQHSNQTG